MTTIERVKAVIGDYTGKPAADIADNAILRSEKEGQLTNGVQYLDLDSLDRIQLGIALGEHFGFEIPDDDLDKEEMGTVDGIASYVDARLIDAVTADAAATGVGIMKDGERVAPEDFRSTPFLPDYTAMSSTEMLADVGLNADRWAEAFVQMAIAHAGITFPDSAAREDFANTCMAWFANAIGSGYDAGRTKIDLYDPNSNEGRAHAWRKKPVEVQAVCFLRVDDDRGQPRVIFNHPTLPQWLAEAFSEPDGQPGAAWSEREEGGAFALRIGTLEGTHTASPGDWIIRGVKGELYPRKPDIFAATYEAVLPETVESDDVPNIMSGVGERWAETK